jgi:hypothetical protein
MTGRPILLVLFLSGLAFSAGCVSLSEKSPSSGLPAGPSFCFVAFPAEPWESVHKIEASFQGRSVSTLLGVTRGDPKGRALNSILMTPEGFILLEAEMRDGEIKIVRAAPPFDSPAFAGGMMEDVGLLFLAPRGKAAPWRKGREDIGICEWKDLDGSRTEIQGSRINGWRITRRNDRGEVVREASLDGPFVRGLAVHMELQAFRPASYNLRLTLLPPVP